MTKTKSYNTFKKAAAAVLGALLACSLLFAWLFALPAVHAADGNVTASGIFNASGASLESDSQNEGGYTHLTYSVGDGGTVAFRRDMALKWYTLADGEDAKTGEVQYFSTEFSFAELNFTSFTLTMETTEMSQSKEGKAVNTIVFTPNTADGLDVSVNGEDAGNFAYTAGDTLVVSFAQDDTFGNFDLKVENLNGGVSLSGEQFTNIGKNFADYASASSETPITPLTFTAETENGEEVLLSILSLNGQSFALQDDNRILDNTPPALVIDSEVKQFVLGSKFDFTMTAIDVCDSSISSSDRAKYYKTNPAESDVVFEDRALKVEEPASEEGGEATPIYTEWESDRYFFESDFVGDPKSVSVAVSLIDDSDNTGWYLLEWFGDYAGNTGDTYGIPVVAPEENSAEKRPNAGFYTWSGTSTEAPVADGTTAETYQEAVKAAAVTEDEDGNQVGIQVGTGAYFYLPSLIAYVSDETCGYTDMEFTIYYTVNGGSTSSNTGLSYDELSIELTQDGTYRFRVVPTNAAGRAAYGVFETSEGSGKYEYKEITSDNVWDALNLATFEFTVVYNGPSVEPSDSDDSGYVDVTFSFEDFEVIALSGYQTKYTLSRVVLFEDSGISSVAALEEAIADGKIAASREAAEEAAEGTYIGYFVEIAEYDDELEEDEGDNVYEWNPASSLSFVPQEIGYYTLTAEVASYPWSNANGTVSAQKSIYVSAESDTVAGETYWLQNNILSVVFLAVGAACLIAIIVLLLVRPKKKAPASSAADTAADASVADVSEKSEQSLKERRKERRNKK